MVGVDAIVLQGILSRKCALDIHILDEPLFWMGVYLYIILLKSDHDTPWCPLFWSGG